MNIVLEKIKGLFERKEDTTPKVNVEIVFRSLLPDEVYLLQNVTHEWNIPGKIAVSNHRFAVIELEGPEALLREKIEQLRIYPQLMRRPMSVKIRPYSGNYKFFSVVFS